MMIIPTSAIPLHNIYYFMPPNHQKCLKDNNDHLLNKNEFCFNKKRNYGIDR